MNRLSLIALALLVSVSSVAGQTSPFDMSTEKGEVGTRTPTEPQTSAPDAVLPQAQDPAPAIPLPSVAKQQQPAPKPDTKAAAPAPRYLLPFPKLTLTGETDRRAWSVVLTPEQAASAAQFHLGYQNSIVTAPELSALRIRINDIDLVEEPVQSPDVLREVVVNVPNGLLKPGANSISISADMRHRTDCTIQSTYELWTEIVPASTFLSFADAGAHGFRRVDDIAAVGVNEAGATAYRIIAPATELASGVGPVVRLAEALAMSSNMPNQSISISREIKEPSGPGTLTVVVGLPSEISGVLSRVPEGASMSPVTTFVDDEKTGASTLVISGPTWPAITTAIESLIQPAEHDASSLRPALSTRSWRLPDAPMLRGRNAMTFAQLGAATSEFTGRRFRTDFAFGVPADFYAEAYGEATLLLDAAYSAEVKPGSHIDVYVNGSIAATVPVTQAGGAILRQLPVNVTMRHFRPGANILAIEAVLLTDNDAVCAPGATGLSSPRFALFDTSQFVMPEYARVARSPDLAGTAGTGFPYNRAEAPVALVVQHSDPAALSAAATMLAQMSVAAGRAIPVDATLSAASASARDALFVGDIANIPPAVLAQVGVSETTRTAWGPEAFDSTETASTGETDATFKRWRDDLSGSGWHGSVSALEDWLYRNFGLTLGSLQLAPGSAEAYMPAGNLGLLVAQQENPAGLGTWTVVSAPTAEALQSGVELLGLHDNWAQIGGRITTVDMNAKSVANLAVGKFEFFETQPPSFTNYRLIAANWLSANALSFAAALAALCALLGLSTKLLLSVLGRRV